MNQLDTAIFTLHAKVLLFSVFFFEQLTLFLPNWVEYQCWPEAAIVGS